jgi:PAS domain S-box-containing protein
MRPTDADLSIHDWRGLNERLPLAVYIDRLDEWSSNIYTSPQLEAILGYTTEEWAAEDHLLLRVLHPDDRERVVAAHLRSCETGEPFRMEYRMISRDGRVAWVLDQATVMPGHLTRRDRADRRWRLLSRSESATSATAAAPRARARPAR